MDSKELKLENISYKEKAYKRSAGNVFINLSKLKRPVIHLSNLP